MSSPNENFDRSESRDKDQVITATTFQPSVANKQGYKPKAWHIALSIFALIGLFCAWFLFTSKSVRMDFSPQAENVTISGGFSFELGGVWLLREGLYQIEAQTSLHHPMNIDLEIGDERNQLHQFQFDPLPGTLKIETMPNDAVVLVNDKTQAKELELEAGEHLVQVTHPRYLPTELKVNIEGKRIVQSIEISLEPNWAEIEVTSNPPGATVLIDGDPWLESTPTQIEALAGERLIEFQLNGFKTHRQRVFAQAQDQWTLDLVNLVQADAQIQLSSRPSAAGVILNGNYIGKTPLLVDLKSAVQHELQLVQAGYGTHRETLKIARGQKITKAVNLRALAGTVQVTVEPTNAEITIDGQLQKQDQFAFTLPLRSHEFRIALDGHAPFVQSVTPKNGLVQELKVRLLTHEEARLAALKPSITTALGQSLKLFTPYDFKMGASRREPGRRANETLRDVKMGRLFYLATHETTNAQFRQFASGHDSGKYVDSTLNEDDQPAANLSWHDAAAFCNWLSDKEGLAPYYEIEFGAVVGTNPSAKGYRLPSEAEWTWAARTLSEGEELLKFPWGENLPPPDRHGNYADRAASSLVGRIIFGYNDNYPAAAPVGSYKPNHRGLFDLGGNVAEWMNDFYEIPTTVEVTDPTGPKSGDYHVIKGPSWMHGSVTELRYSFRDYGIDGRQDIGFRIARSAE